MLSKCYKSSTDFRTVFVFALEPFLPMWVLFLFQRELQWENGQKNVTAIKSSKSVLQLLQPSSLSLLSYFFIVLFRDTPLAPIGRTLADGQNGHLWPYGHCKNKTSSEICGQIVKFCDHAHLQILNFIKIRIPLLLKPL